ncbi:hypothetical protein [Occallatibacter riparius]|uniref:Uncharacterized protein n=1 Tax=Occallatibacter riparius TaxID=1002689 RepID=A0A9J7BIC7_9BACT|nr:hypothetical protein [Occallatibacter riparius]UWZ82692.1 hypothetical protein MOP44_19230 [Occallatibacter riparius]
MANGLDDKWFPTISNPQNATQAMHNGAYAASLVAVVTGAINVAAILTQTPVLGAHGWGLIDATLFAVVAWRVYRLSLPWAIAGLVLYILERVSAILLHPHLTYRIVIILMVLPYYWNAIRGGLYLRRTKTANSPLITPEELKASIQPFESNTLHSHSASVQESRMPQANEDEYSEFLECMRRGERKFQKAGYTLHQEYAAWLKDYRKKRALAEAAREKASSNRPA